MKRLLGEAKKLRDIPKNLIINWKNRKNYWKKEVELFMSFSAKQSLLSGTPSHLSHPIHHSIKKKIGVKKKQLL